MGRPRHSVLALCVVVLAATAAGGASAQDNQWNRLDLKPLLPPVLPPHAQVAPDSLSQAATPGDLPALNKSQTQTTPAGGLRITIPTR